MKQVSGTVALMVLGVSFTKRFYTFPHFHKDESKPMYLSNGELHPGEKQPAVSLNVIGINTYNSIGNVRLDIQQARGSNVNKVNVMVFKSQLPKPIRAYHI